MKSRDGANRVVEIEYFKSNDCKLEGNKLKGKPTRIIRGLESLSRLNQDALDSCKIRKFLNHKCVPQQDQVPILENDARTKQNNTETDEIDTQNAEDDTQEITSLEEMDPDINTTVWIEKATNQSNEQNQHTNQKQEHLDQVDQHMQQQSQQNQHNIPQNDQNKQKQTFDQVNNQAMKEGDQLKRQE